MLASKPVTMVATLGGQPQVVTFALDALLAQGVPVERLVVLYLSSGERTQRSLDRLALELDGGSYCGRPLSYTLEAVQIGRRVVGDIVDEADADAVWRAVNLRIARLKSEEQVLHICISGGRRLLGLLTMSAAMLHFGHQDVLWHMYTPTDIQEEAEGGGLMHLPPDSGFRLIRVPMMPWGSYFPTLRELARPVEGEDVLLRPKQILDYGEQARCRAVAERLTKRQFEVLTLLADGHNPQTVAARLGVKLSTVDSHKTIILDECRNAWNLPDDTWLDYRFVREKFHLYIRHML